MNRLSKREKRKLRQEGILDENAEFNPRSFSINSVTPLTTSQRKAFEHWNNGHNLVLHGLPGTGKSYLSLYFAIKSVFEVNLYKQVIVIRSAVPARNQGFEKGSIRQKEALYESPYAPICNDLFSRGDAYSLLKQKNMLDFRSTSFLRGLTFDDCIVFVDEIQNMSDQELHTIITRVGQNCRIIFSGDGGQDDLTSKRFQEESGLQIFMNIINNMNEFRTVEFGLNDIVRSGLVKSYIMERHKLGY